MCCVAADVAMRVELMRYVVVMIVSLCYVLCRVVIMVRRFDERCDALHNARSCRLMFAVVPGWNAVIRVALFAMFVRCAVRSLLCCVAVLGVHVRRCSRMRCCDCCCVACCVARC